MWTVKPSDHRAGAGEPIAVIDPERDGDLDAIGDDGTDGLANRPQADRHDAEAAVSRIPSR